MPACTLLRRTHQQLHLGSVCSTLHSVCACVCVFWGGAVVWCVVSRHASSLVEHLLDACAHPTSIQCQCAPGSPISLLPAPASALICNLLPAASRKKDHGRAEALLIAAWGCGWSAEQPRNNGSSSSKDGMLHQGPLRDVVQVDGGMHLLASSSRTNGAASGPDTPDTAVEGADLADGAVATAAFVPASAAVKKAQKEAKPSAKAAPRKKKQGAQPAAARPAVAGRDLAVVSTAAGQQSEAGLHAGSNLAKCKKKATPNKRTVAVQGSGCMQLQQINS